MGGLDPRGRWIRRTPPLLGGGQAEFAPLQKGVFLYFWRGIFPPKIKPQGVGFNFPLFLGDTPSPSTLQALVPEFVWHINDSGTPRRVRPEGTREMLYTAPYNELCDWGSPLGARHY